MQGTKKKEDIKELLSKKEQAGGRCWFPILVVLICLRLNLSAGVSFRGCPKALKAFFLTIPSLESIAVPSRTTVQRWMAKVGYHKLHCPLEKADDWIILIDESIQVGSQKYLTIFGCRAKNLPVGRSLTLDDLIPLHAVVLAKSDGNIIRDILNTVTLRVGGIMAICSDECSNLVRAFRLYQEDHPETKHIPDITHKVANMVKKRLNIDLEWKQFIKMINTTKLKMYNSSLAHLAPPSLRGKSRFLNLDILIEWTLKVLELLKTGNTSSAYDDKIAEEYLGWLRKFEEPIKYYSNMLDVVSLVRHLVRQNGIHRHIADEFAIEFENASLHSSVEWDVAACTLANEIYEFLYEQGNKTGIGQVLLGSSESIETFFGKYKSMQGDQTKAGFSRMVLAGIAHVGVVNKSLVQAAIETVSHAQVDKWVQANVGITVHAKRCKIFGKHNKKLPLLPYAKSIEMAQELAGFSIGEAMGF